MRTKRKMGMSARQLRRVSDKYSFTTQAKLQTQVERFLKETAGKTEAECRSIYDFFNKKWQTYAQIENKYRPYTVFGDAFEASIETAWRKLRDATQEKCNFDLEDARRVCDYFRIYTKTEIFWKNIGALLRRKKKQLN